MKKIAILLSLLLSAGNLLASSEPETTSRASKSQSFAYEKEVFSLHVTSDVDLETPSLAGLYQDALARKTHLDALFNHVRANKFNKTQNKPLFDYANYSNNILKNLGGSDRPKDLQLINILQAEYMPERDLVDYFLQALGHFAQTPPSQAQIQELYKQAVYVCRMNLSSVHMNLFFYLNYQYPKAYFMGEGGKQYQDLDFMVFHDEEDRFYASIREHYPRNGLVNDLDTIAITKIARYCMSSPTTFKNPGLIFELNSLFFYLNIERALLSACPDLVFVPADYSFQKDVESQNSTFALSRIADYHRQGAFYGLMKNTKASERQFSPYLKMKDRLLELTLNNKAQEATDFFLNQLFPPIKKVETPTVIKSKPAQGKSSKKPTPSKKPAQSQRAKPTPTLPTLTPPLELLLLEDSSHEDALLVTPEELQEIDILIEQEVGEKRTYASILTSNMATTGITELPIAPYKPRLHADDYTYKRCVSTSIDGSYLFMDQPFIMKGTFFDVDTLRQIKELTHHDPSRPNLQNMASCRMRFHFQHQDGKLDIMDFTTPYQYLSGGRRLNAEHREAHHIKMAFHDYLTPSQAKSYLQKGKDENRTFLLNTLSSELNECAVQGPWHHNCADSEALMVIDLQKEMPEMLKAIAPSTGEKITLLGAVLGASSYHDVCWRCRNLLQGWQWGLDDTITHWKDAYHLPITLSPDFSTIVFGFGEVAPQSHDFFPPKASKEATVLGLSGHETRERHKLKVVSLKKETL